MSINEIQRNIIREVEGGSILIFINVKVCMDREQLFITKSCSFFFVERHRTESRFSKKQ